MSRVEKDCKYYIDGYCDIGTEKENNYICASEQNKDCYYRQFLGTQAQYEKVVEQNKQLRQDLRKVQK